jgi:hypothetical protein|tara:strand:+ start:65 stop:304 length:240 start_codon:yes stop_codon:yes gene_type:complete
MPSKYNKTKKKTEWVSEDGDFVLDGFDDPSEDIFGDSSARGIFDDTDDYEYQQENANGLQSENLQPIPTDRYLKRFGKG